MQCSNCGINLTINEGLKNEEYIKCLSCGYIIQNPIYIQNKKNKERRQWIAVLIFLVVVIIFNISSREYSTSSKGNNRIENYGSNKGPNFYEELDRKSAMIENAIKEKGLNVNRCGSLMTVFFNDERVKSYDEARACDTESYGRYYRHMLQSGIYTAPSQFEAMFVSYAHSDEDIAKTIDAIKAYR